MSGVRTITPTQALGERHWAVVVTRGDGFEFVEELAFSEAAASELAGRLRAMYGHEGGTVEVARIEEPPQLVDAVEAAQVLGCTPAYVRRLCREGAIKAIKLGDRGDWRVNRASLMEYAGLVESKGAEA